MLATFNELSAKISEVATAEIKDFRQEAARSEQCKAATQQGHPSELLEKTTPQPPSMVVGKTELMSPLLNIVQQVSSAAHQRVNSEWQSFEAEAARTEGWKAEEELLQQRRDGKAAPVAGSAVEDPALRRLEFSIEDDASPAPAKQAPEQSLAPYEEEVLLFLLFATILISCQTHPHHPTPPHPTPSHLHRIQSNPTPSHLIPTHPIPSHPIPSIPSHPPPHSTTPHSAHCCAQFASENHADLHRYVSELQVSSGVHVLSLWLMGYYLLRTTYYLLTVYCLLLLPCTLTAHCSLLSAHCSLLTAYCLLLTTYYVPLAAHCFTLRVTPSPAGRTTCAEIEGGAAGAGAE